MYFYYHYFRNNHYNCKVPQNNYLDGRNKVLLLLTDLEVVEALELASHRVQLLVVRLLDLTESLRHLALPELTVLGRRVAVGESSQLLHLLRTRTRQAFVNKYS